MDAKRLCEPMVLDQGVTERNEQGRKADVWKEIVVA